MKKSKLTNSLKKAVSLLLISVLTLSLLTACGSKSESSSGSSKSGEEHKKITIAYQYGISYFPLLVMKEKNLIEKQLPGVEVEWQQLNSGAAICEGITSGSIDVGAMGTGPMIINTP